MFFLDIIDKYYSVNGELKQTLLIHSRMVADRCLAIAHAHPELNLDIHFLEEAAMLHDIGIFKTNAPSIFCTGTHPYVCHGFLGAELLRKEGFPRHARVCERHTGAGICSQEVKERNIPIPIQDYLPETLEEKVICYADKFYSKSHLNAEKTPQQVMQSLLKFGTQGGERFQSWITMFG